MPFDNESFSKGFATGYLLGRELKKPLGLHFFSKKAEFSISLTHPEYKYWEGKIEYSYNQIKWIEWNHTDTIFSKKKHLYMRGVGNEHISGYSSSSIIRDNSWIINGTDVFCEGNIEDILDYETVKNGEHPQMKTYCFCRLFRNCTCLKSSPRLPSLHCPTACYKGMFAGCINLLSAPELPSTSIGPDCYAEMFLDCTSLVSAPPELPAEKLYDNCYYSMFANCINLVNISTVLPAKVAAAECYERMFLNTAIIEPPSILLEDLPLWYSKSCCEAMFYRCKNLKEAPELLATNTSDRCYMQMFSGCTSLVSAPSELPAQNLSKNCYHGMFAGCSSLIETPKIKAINLAERCCESMFSNCSSLTLVDDLIATSMAPYCYADMFSYCSSLKKAPNILATNSASYCFQHMFFSCENLEEPPEELLPARLESFCCQEMFYGCRSLKKSLKILATTVSESCCEGMFGECRKLKVLPKLYSTNLAPYCYMDMFEVTVYTVPRGEYIYEYRVPITGYGIDGYYSIYQMLFPYDPDHGYRTLQLNTTYYASQPPI